MLEFNKRSHGDADVRNIAAVKFLICSRAAVLGGHAEGCGLMHAGGPGHENKFGSVAAGQEDDALLNAVRSFWTSSLTAEQQTHK